MIRAVTTLTSPKPSPIVFTADKRVRISDTTVIVYPEKKEEPKIKDLIKDVFIANTEKKHEKDKTRNSSRP